MVMRYPHDYPESLRAGIEVLDPFRQELAQSANSIAPPVVEEGRERLVAGRGFEPLTFGL